MQVVVHLRNTQASSRKELPAALRRRSGHESSADWLTATEQRDKNVAAAYSCWFSSIFHPSVPSFYSVLFWSIVLFPLVLYPLWVLSSVLSSIRSIRSIGLLFSRPYSLTLTVRASPLFSILVFFETLLSSSSWIVLRAFFRSLLLVHEFSFVQWRNWDG